MMISGLQKFNRLVAGRLGDALFLEQAAQLNRAFHIP
jgi:hypothetical protein